MKKILMSIISLAFMALSTSAMAATTAAVGLDVSASGVISCTSTSGAINFGSYDGTTDLSNMGSAGASCNAGGVSIVISLNSGVNYDTVNSTRRLANGTNYLDYELYGDSGNTVLFGDGTIGSTYAMTTSTTTLSASHAVWGKLLAGQALVGGAYSDTVDVTVTY